MFSSGLGSTGDGRNPVDRAKPFVAARSSATNSALARSRCAATTIAVRPLGAFAGARLDSGSRMRRESHVRFCERAGVGSPRATHLVILCRRGSAEKALHHLRAIMGKLKLTVNEEKTRICRVPDAEFDFLGYTFGRMYSPETGKARLGYRPSRKSIKRMVDRVHALTDRAGTWQETTRLVDQSPRMGQLL